MRTLSIKTKIKRIRTSALFICLLAFLGLDGWGVAPVVDGINVDLLLLPGVLAALVGGPLAGALAGLLWALVRPWEGGFVFAVGMNAFSLLAASGVYSFARFTRPVDPYSPYYAVAVAGILRSLIWWVGLGGAGPSGALLKCFFETGFALIVMALVLEQLRKHHILNGIRCSKRCS